MFDTTGNSAYFQNQKFVTLGALLLFAIPHTQTHMKNKLSVPKQPLKEKYGIYLIARYKTQERLQPTR
jgi:hypothetical protein